MGPWECSDPGKSLRVVKKTRRPAKQSDALQSRAARDSNLRGAFSEGSAGDVGTARRG